MARTGQNSKYEYTDQSTSSEWKLGAKTIVDKVHEFQLPINITGILISVN